MEWQTVDPVCSGSTLFAQTCLSKNYLFQCLLFVLGCKDSEELSLTGHHLESLAELAINKFSAVSTLKFLNVSTLEKSAVIILKSEQCGSTIE